jgi:ribosomal protein L7Ae-like RNA K-turn-binding protein
METYPVKLAMNKTVTIPLRSDVDLDITALRVGKSRVARNKIKKQSALKLAILHRRGNEDPHGEPAHDCAPSVELQNQTDDAKVHPNISYMDYRGLPELDDIVFDILKELARLQAKGKDQPQEKRYKYKKFVVGFREVHRALKRDELKGIVISTNLEPVEELVNMISELKSECESREVPLVFSLSRRQMGKALGKTMKQSLVGITNLDGVHQPWKQVVNLIDSLKSVS